VKGRKEGKYISPLEKEYPSLRSGSALWSTTINDPLVWLPSNAIVYCHYYNPRHTTIATASTSPFLPVSLFPIHLVFPLASLSSSYHHPPSPSSLSLHLSLITFLPLLESRSTLDPLVSTHPLVFNSAIDAPPCSLPSSSLPSCLFSPYFLNTSPLHLFFFLECILFTPLSLRLRFPLLPLSSLPIP